MPLLKLIIKRYPNVVTFYEWKFNEIPTKLEKFQFVNETENMKEVKKKIESFIIII